MAWISKRDARKREHHRRAAPLTAPVTLTFQRGNGGLPLFTPVASLPSSSSTTITTTTNPLPPATPTPSITQQQQPTPTNASDVSTNGTPNPATLFKAVPGGTIAAIVIAVVLVITGVCIYIFRKKSRQARKRKMLSLGNAIFNKPLAAGGEGALDMDYTNPRAPPLNSPGGTSLGFNPADYNNAQAYALRNGLVTAMAPPSPSLRPPPMSYNNPGPEPVVGGLQVALGTAVGIGMTMGTASPLRSPAPTPMSSAVVQCTFIPTLPDELSITTGETIRIMAEYDDGWALCLNLAGEQGMVPLECLGKGIKVNADNMSERRDSSLTSRRV